MVDDPEFRAVLDKNIRRGSAFCVRGAEHLLGGLLLSARPSAYRIGWLVVAGASRGQGVGSALVAEAATRVAPPVSLLEVLTFGAEHPAAAPSGARAFYERLGFQPGEIVESPGADGPRQWYRRAVGGTH
ncbi:GNAT family N-acetyltransferase [Micromonospora sp. NPDC047753]|uniref:GNAT family N-acetyltransferase n=1 Tax=Micromonospora sp. NPDC047753 TaxID=3154817 RepID=UPI0033D3CB63